MIGPTLRDPLIVSGRRLALQLLLDNIYSTADAGKLTLLVSLGLSAAFDTIDHAVLLKRLSCSFGITGTVHSCRLQSYLTGRIGSHSSPVTPSPVGVPKTLSLSFFLSTPHLFPLLLSLNMADDTQLFLALSPANHIQSISVLQSCLNYLHIWFCENGMALNPNKSVAILFGTPQRLMIAVLA